MSFSALPRSYRWLPRHLSVAVLAAWGASACAQTPAASNGARAPAVTQSPAASGTDGKSAADALGDLLHQRTDSGTPAGAPASGDAVAAEGAAQAASGVAPQATSQAAVAGTLEEAQLMGPPEPPPPPVVLFPSRLGQFLPDPPPPTSTEAEAAQPTADGAAESTPKTPPVLASQVPAFDPAEDSVRRLGYSGRAAFEDRDTTARACPGGTLTYAAGGGVACKSTGDVNVKESLLTLDGGGQVQVVAQAKGTDATTVNGRPTAVDPYAVVPQLYTAVTGLGVLEGATMWAGRRDVSPFLLSSGLLPPTSPAMRFGVDNASFGTIGLNYEYTARSDINGQALPSYHSLRTNPVDTNKAGSLQFGFTRVEGPQVPTTVDTGGAWWASAMHEQKGVLAGTNRLGVQYGEGSRAAMTGYTGMGAALSRVRVADSMEWKGNSGLAGAVESSVQFDRSPVGTLQWMTTRVRPSYVASDQFKLSFEVAHDQISSGFGAGGQRTAVTVAPTYTLGKSAGNANLRAFYTYSRANDVDGVTFAAPADTWASQASGSIFGVQLNRRW